MPLPMVPAPSTATVLMESEVVMAQFYMIPFRILARDAAQSGAALHFCPNGQCDWHPCCPAMQAGNCGDGPLPPLLRLAKLRPVGAARPESGAADLRARLLAVFAARLGRALFRPLALSDLADALAGAVLVLGACILRERFRGAARIRRPRYCFAFRRRKHGQQLVNGGRRIAEQLRRGQALDGVRLRRIEVEGFLDGEPGPFKKRKRHTELEGGEIAEMEEVVAPLHGFVGDAGLVEHVAKLEMQARIFAAPERAKRVLFRITGRDLRRRRGKRVRARRLAMDEWHAAVGANAEAIAVLSFAFRADHSNSIGPVQPGSGYPPRPPRAVSSARRPELRHCLRRGRVPRCRASDCGAEVRTAR